MLDLTSQIVEGKLKVEILNYKFAESLLTKKQQFFPIRNELLINDGFKPPKATKTGTTIVGIVYKDGVILGADTRATSGNIVSDKNCEKIHFLAKNM